MIKPSFIDLLISGFFIFTALFILIKYYKKINKENLLKIILLFSIAFSVHGLLHANYENFFGWNPLSGKFIPK
jgi:hypothetical protein